MNELVKCIYYFFENGSVCGTTSFACELVIYVSQDLTQFQQDLAKLDGN